MSVGGCCFRRVVRCLRPDLYTPTVVNNFWPFPHNTYLKWMDQWAWKHDHVVFLMDTFPLTSAAQVIVWTNRALESGTHNWAITAITDHIWMHQILRTFLAARLTVQVFTLQFLFL